MIYPGSTLPNWKDIDSYTFDFTSPDGTLYETKFGTYFPKEITIKKQKSRLVTVKTDEWWDFIFDLLNAGITMDRIQIYMREIVGTCPEIFTEIYTTPEVTPRYEEFRKRRMAKIAEEAESAAPYQSLEGKTVRKEQVMLANGIFGAKLSVLTRRDPNFRNKLDTSVENTGNSLAQIVIMPKDNNN